MLFFAIFAMCFLFLWKEQKYYDEVLKEKQWIENGLLEAIENTAKEFTEVIYDSQERKKEIVESFFWESFYAELGVFDEKEQQDRLKMHLPLLVLVEKDGMLFYYMQENSRNGETELGYVWTDKISMPFSDDTMEAKKKQILSDALEEKASEIITEHNYIAKQYGIKYTFSVPDFLQNTAENLEFPMLFVVFQGWPLTAAGDIVYENCMDAGVYLQEVEYYRIELPENLNDTISVYHRMDCEEVIGKEGQGDEMKMTEEEAIKKYGAFPCEICIP